LDPGIVQIVDTCVLINLLASGRIEEILRATSKAHVICPIAAAELIYLRSDDPRNPRERVDLDPLIDNGTLAICDIQGQTEDMLYVNYASLLDDGEAMSLALAISRGFHLVTDERKARRLFMAAANDSKRLVSTSELIRGWAEAEGIERRQLSEILNLIYNRARYHPPATDVNYRWWFDV
jgi:predicted nucleic acid-binding protein